MGASTPRLLAATLLLVIPAVAGAADVRIQNANFAADSNKILVKGILDAIPAGTPVSLIQDSNGRTLAIDADGNKQFNFQVPIPVGQAVPCHLRIEAGEERAYVQVRHSPTCGQQTVTLSGQVVDDPIPYATVTVTVGGVTYTTIADIDGRYSLDIATASLDELVTIEAVGNKVTNGETIPIDFVSLAGSFSKLLEDASGGVISDQTNQKVNVTNVSTAEYVLLVEANGGTAPTTAEELQQAETQVDATELLQLAAVIKLIVDGGVALPDGFTTVLDFIENGDQVTGNQTQSPLDQFIAANETQLEGVVLQILEAGGLVAGFRVQDVPARYLVTGATEPGFVPRSGEVLEFATERPSDCATAEAGCVGLSMLRDLNGLPVTVPFKWYIEGGVLEIDVTTPTATPVFSSVKTLLEESPDLLMSEDGSRLADCVAPDDQASASFFFQQSVLGYSYTRFNDGQALDSLFRRARLFRSGFPQITCEDGTPRTIAPYPIEATGQVMARDSGAIAPRRFVSASNPTVAADEIVAEGEWVLQVYARLRRPGGFQRVIFSDIVRLEAGGGASALVAAEAGTNPGDYLGPTSWTIDSATGELVLSYPDGVQQRVIVTDSLDLDGDGDVDELGAFSLFTDGSQRYASSDLTFKRDPAVVADLELVRSPPGMYWQTVINSWTSSAWRDAPGGGRELQRTDQIFGFHVAPVGVGYQGSFIPPTPGAANCTSGTWIRRALADLELEFPGTLNVVNMNYTGPGGQYRQRIWSVAATQTVGSERRLNVLEMEKLPLSAGEPHRLPPRPNSYREYVEPNLSFGACVANSYPFPPSSP
jgi:hypothetical protein